MQNSIESINSKSAKFYKVDLHLHSPLSFDWKNDSTHTYTRNPLLNRIGASDKISKKQLEAFIDELEKSTLDVAAITDHMKYSFGVALAEYVKKKKRDIVILPGIGIDVRINQPVLNECKIHVLAIFPPDIGKKIEKIFPPDFKSESERNGKDDELLVDDIDDFIKKVRDLGGKTVATHVEINNGVRCAYIKGDTLMLKPLSEANREVWKKFYKNTGDTLNRVLYKFDSLQIAGTTDFVHFKTGKRYASIPLIMGTDALHVNDFGSGNKITYVKMREKNVPCLYEALNFPDMRIRFEADLPKVKPPRIRGIRLIGHPGNDKALFKSATLGFSNNLTCIVGPRGSGKSAIIDAIRYVMGYNRSLDEIEKVKKQILDRQANTLEASKIELLYEKSNGIMHKIVSIYDSKESYSTKVYSNDDNELNIEDVEASGEYPLNLYGWNELELLGEDPRSQRENLDKFIKGVGNLKSKKKRLYESLVMKSNQCLEQLDVLEAFFDPSLQETSFVRLNEFRDEFNKLNPRGIEEKFEKLDEIIQKMSFLTHLKEKVSSIDKDFAGLSGIDYENALLKHTVVDAWCKDLIQNRLKINNVNDEIIERKNEIAGSISDLVQIVEKEEKKLHNAKNETSKEIRTAIGEKEAITAALRSNAKKRLDSAIEQFEAYKRGLGIFEGYLNERRGIIEKINEINQRIYETRKEGISEIISKISIVTDASFNIDLKLTRGKDKTDFWSGLENNNIDIKYGGHRDSRRVAHLISDKLSPFTFADALFNNSPEELIHKISFIDNNIEHSYSLDKKYAQKFMEDNIPYENVREINIRRYDREKTQRIFLIQHIPFDDQFYIELNGRPIQSCSPGQRCSAMLPIVTLTSDSPIIIDQPEDNLDNRLVSKAIFKILSKLKETRQIIVATHNPNILVSGDAEQVIVLRGSGEIVQYGSIDEPPIVENVIELMEGGKEAFERRKNKYKDHF